MIPRMRFSVKPCSHVGFNDKALLREKVTREGSVRLSAAAPCQAGGATRSTRIFLLIKRTESTTAPRTALITHNW